MPQPLPVTPSSVTYGQVWRIVEADGRTSTAQIAISNDDGTWVRAGRTDPQTGLPRNADGTVATYLGTVLTVLR